MIDVEPVTINVKLPQNNVQIVAMQPFIRFRSSHEEPFQWAAVAIDEQLVAISRTLDIAQRGINGQSTNFILFPEYSIPGYAGAKIIQERITADGWPNNSIIIAGIHGISQNEYEILCRRLGARFSASNSPSSVNTNQWVNCCVIWVKDDDGLISVWVQPKLHPARPEATVPCEDMFCGSSLFVFECRYEPSRYPCRFIAMICFDWIASDAGHTVRDELLAQLNQLWDPQPGPLHWAFVIQHNRRPNHPAFLNSTYQFLMDVNKHPFVERSDAIVVHANTAVSPKPTQNGTGAFSACVFAPSDRFDCSACRPTVCMQPKSLRGSDILDRCKDVVFREMGECIHAFAVRVPRFVTPDVTDRTSPLLNANVYAICNSADPRLPNGPVPASVKYVGDSLDRIERLSVNLLKKPALKTRAEKIEGRIINKMRTPDGHVASKSVNWATCSYVKGENTRDSIRQGNADLWDKLEMDALEHVLHSLTSIGLAYQLNFDDVPLHGSIQADNGFIRIIAIRGETPQDCRQHYDECISKSGSDPVLVIARGNNLLPTVEEEYLKDGETAGRNGIVFFDYLTLISYCQKSADSTKLKELLDEIIPQDKPII